MIFTDKVSHNKWPKVDGFVGHLPCFQKHAPSVLLHSLSPAVPILERKGYAFDFPEKEKKGQKRANYLKIWAKIGKI